MECSFFWWGGLFCFLSYFFLLLFCGLHFKKKLRFNGDFFSAFPIKLRCSGGIDSRILGASLCSCTFWWLEWYYFRWPPFQQSCFESKQSSVGMFGPLKSPHDPFLMHPAICVTQRRAQQMKIFICNSFRQQPTHISVPTLKCNTCPCSKPVCGDERGHCWLWKWHLLMVVAWANSRLLLLQNWPNHSCNIKKSSHCSLCSHFSLNFGETCCTF